MSKFYKWIGHEHKWRCIIHVTLMGGCMPTQSVLFINEASWIKSPAALVSSPFFLRSGAYPSCHVLAFIICDLPSLLTSRLVIFTAFHLHRWKTYSECSVVVVSHHSPSRRPRDTMRTCISLSNRNTSLVSLMKVSLGLN